MTRAIHIPDPDTVHAPKLVYQQRRWDRSGKSYIKQPGTRVFILPEREWGVVVSHVDRRVGFDEFEYGDPRPIRREYRVEFDYTHGPNKGGSCSRNATMAQLRLSPQSVRNIAV